MWEGVGICSYLLVNFWFTRIAANQSSISALLTNRVGDCFLIIGMLGLLWTLGNLDYSTIFSLAPYINTNVVTIIGICLLIGAMAKSAQIGLHIWLPMAMEGPTPVSALIHAATMVTAGVYLLIRSSPLIEYSSTLLLICLWLGAITTLSSSMIGLFQGDIKKIIAYSTMSQLGMMVVAIGLSSYNVALFHLINHAFYKGLLFLGAGAVIHAVSDNQDLRKYGGLIHWLPLTYSVILIASLSLVAFPFMTGFYSKDLILESSYGQYHFPSIAVYFIAVIGAVFTTLYSVKVLYLTFIANPNGSLNYYKNAHEGNICMSLPLIILAIFSIYFGFLTKDIYVGLGSGFFNNNSIFIHPVHEILISAEFGLSTFIKLLPFILTVLGTGFAITLFEFYPSITNNFKLSNLGYNIFGFFNQRLLIEFFVNKYIVILTLKLGSQTTKVLDRGSIELIGPFGAEKLLLWTGKLINCLSTGMVTNYALYIIIGIIVYLMGNNFYLFNISNSLLLSIICINIFINILDISKYSSDKDSYRLKLESKISGGTRKTFILGFILALILIVAAYLYFEELDWFINSLIIISSLEIGEFIKMMFNSTMTMNMGSISDPTGSNLNSNKSDIYPENKDRGYQKAPNNPGREELDDLADEIDPVDSDDEMESDFPSDSESGASDEELREKFEEFDHEPIEHVRAAREIRVAERSQKVLREHPEVADQTLRDNHLDPSEKDNLDNKLEEHKNNKLREMKEDYIQEGMNPEEAERKLERRIELEREHRKFNLEKGKKDLDYTADDYYNNIRSNNNNNNNNSNN